MLKTALLAIGILVSTVVFANASSAEDYVRCSDAAHVTAAAKSIANVQRELRIFAAGVCQTAPALCPDLREMMVGIKALGPPLQELGNQLSSVCR